MLDHNVLTGIYRQNLENDIIKELARQKNLDMIQAMNIYYKSELAEHVETGLYGIDNMDYRYLVNDLIENESNLFEEYRDTK
ncbi:MAG: hypothetical protein E7262_06855 [Lachnospiraceae bacterium]|nr:hypothetical protein [Lachnospiraceae bacterium]